MKYMYCQRLTAFAIATACH